MSPHEAVVELTGEVLQPEKAPKAATKRKRKAKRRLTSPNGKSVAMDNHPQPKPLPKKPPPTGMVDQIGQRLKATKEIDRPLGLDVR